MKVLVVHRQETIADHIKDQVPHAISLRDLRLGWSFRGSHKHYDLVINSYYLPVVTGFEMVRSFRMV